MRIKQISAKSKNEKTLATVSHSLFSFKKRLGWGGFVALLLLAMALNVTASTWYVDCSATNGLNNGTSWSNAWLSLNSVNANTGAYRMGDTVYISGGTTSQTYTGAANFSPIGLTVMVGQDAAHGGTVIFDGTGLSGYWVTKMQSSSISGNYQGTNHMLVTNYYYGGVAVQGDGSIASKLDHINFSTSIRFNGATNMELAYLNIVPANGEDYAIMWTVYPDKWPGSYTNNSIHNCFISPPRQDDNSGYGSDCIQNGTCSSVYSNTFSPYLVPTFTESPCCQHQDCWQGEETAYLAFYDNTVMNLGNYGFFFCFMNSQNAQNFLVYNNIFKETLSQNLTSATANVGVVIGPLGTDATQNYIYSNIVVANNTFVDMFGRSAIGLGNTGSSSIWTNCYVFNNLILDCGGTGGYPAASSENNSKNPCPIFGYNLVQAGPHGTTNIDLSGLTQTVIPINSSPVQFVTPYVPLSQYNDFHIGSSDTVTAQATNLSTIFPFLAYDKDGAPRPAAGSTTNWNVGAYQFVNVSLSPGPTNVHFISQQNQ